MTKRDNPDVERHAIVMETHFAGRRVLVGRFDRENWRGHHHPDGELSLVDPIGRSD